MNSHLHLLFAPLLPWLGLAVLASLALALVAFALHRRARGTLLRAALLGLLLLTLANPSVVNEKHEAVKDTALLVIDDSASMKLGHRVEQTTLAVEAITQKLAVAFDIETLHVVGIDETNLFHAIEQKRGAMPADRLAGIIAITDGQIHDAPSGALPVPFHALIAGAKAETDRRITVTSAPAYGMVGQQATATIRVTDEPRAASDTAIVTMTQDDGSTQSLTVPVGKDTPVTIPLSHAGTNNVAFEVEPLPQELTATNNIATASVNGIRDRLRVLLVSSAPHSGGRSWRNFLKADAAVDLVHFTILRSPFKDNSIPNHEMSLIAFPAQELFETKLKNFDLVIFDGLTDHSLIPDSYLANIATYVENGGALLIANATGEQAAQLGQSPLARILPTTTRGGVLTGSFVPAISDAGKRHPVTAHLGDVMPPNQWSPWYAAIDAEARADSAVLMTGLNNKPLLVLAHVGKGRVAQLLSNQLWLWARHYPNGGPQGELLRRTAHWLVQEPELDESALRAHAEKTDAGWNLIITQQSLHDDTAHAVVTGSDGQPVQINLTDDAHSGTLRGLYPVKDSGLYHIKTDAHEILVMAGAAHTPEYGAMVATDTILAPIAQQSGGSTLWLADHPDGGDLRLKKNNLYRVTGSATTPLCPAWLALTLLLLVAMAAWRREGR